MQSERRGRSRRDLGMFCSCSSPFPSFIPCCAAQNIPFLGREPCLSRLCCERSRDSGNHLSHSFCAAWANAEDVCTLLVWVKLQGVAGEFNASISVQVCTNAYLDGMMQFHLVITYIKQNKEEMGLIGYLHVVFTCIAVNVCFSAQPPKWVNPDAS